LREFQLRPTETFLYTCGAIDLWEWEVRLLDKEPGSVGCRNTARWSRSASTWKKPINAWRSARTS
jgi:hypothetical protein